MEIKDLSAKAMFIYACPITSICELFSYLPDEIGGF